MLANESAPRRSRRSRPGAPIRLAGIALALALALSLPGVSQDTGEGAAEPPQEEQPGESEVELGAGEEEVGDDEEEVVEGDPESREPLWRLSTRLGNRAELAFPTGHRDLPRVAIKGSPTGVAWHIRLGLGPFPLDGKEGYMLHFQARSDLPRKLSVGLAQLRRPYRALTPVFEVETTPLWGVYHVRFVPEEGEEVAAIMFNLGGSRHSVEVTGLELIRGSDRAVVVQGPEGRAERPARTVTPEPAATAAGESAPGGAPAATGR
jgi:hypothetical protein